ncbi:FAD-dependent oxidoreductase [Pedococcus sp. P5_B7]
MIHYDVAIVGAGPAGLAAAVTAGERGLRIALIDSAQQLGGQYWRHSAVEMAEVEKPSGQHMWQQFVDLRTRLRGLEDTATAGGRVDRFSAHTVWFVNANPGRSFELHLTPTASSDRAAIPSIRTTSLVLSPGGYDRQLPIPGWDLPGVMAAGGVQAMLKGHGSLAGKRALIAGTGPFLLPVAVGLAEAGAEVVAVCEAGSPSGWARTPLGAVSAPSKGLEAAKYALALVRHRIPFRTRTVVTAIRGEDQVSSAVLGKLDGDGHLKRDAEVRSVDVDLVALGWGFTPSLELVTALGATTRLDVDDSQVAVVDDWQRSDIPGLYVAGEATGVGGAVLALLEGELAAIAASCDAGGPVPQRRVRQLQRRIARMRRFARSMHRAHPIPAGWREWLEPSTIICRCEEVAYEEVCAARDLLGADDMRTVKLLARPGMGWCQARVCGFATASLAKQPSDRVSASDLASVSKRTFAAPISLGELAGPD